jgi:hypothetical protein
MLRQFPTAAGRVAFLFIGVCFTELIFFISVQRISFACANLLLMAISYMQKLFLQHPIKVHHFNLKKKLFY